MGSSGREPDLVSGAPYCEPENAIKQKRPRKK
jgi:hypothetical protein